MLHYAHIAFFVSLYLLTSAYAVGRGGRPERLTTVMMAMGLLLTVALIGGHGSRYREPEYTVAMVDTLMLVGFVWLALTADRYWTLWLAAIQAVTVLSHLAMILKPVPLPTYYKNTVQLWSYPQLVLLAIGTLRHRLRGRHAAWFERRLGRVGASLQRRLFREPAAPASHRPAA